MNERIKELAGQARLMSEETISKKISKNAELDAFAEKFAELIVNAELDAFAEKFAELIVKECLTVIGKERRAMLDKADLTEAHIMQKNAIAIIKHFEFKE